jgi:MFS family permease
MPKINKVIRILITSDFILQAGWGLIGPIFAIFIIENVKGGSIAAIGLAAATYWLTKSVVQLFIGRMIDFKKGEKDDFIFLIAGMFIANLVPLGYLLATNVSYIFILEFIRGLAMACVLPAWAGIFTRHINKGSEAFSWSLESTGIGIAFGFAAAFGGAMAAVLGFEILFFFVSFLGLVSTFVLFLIRPYIYTQKKFVPKIPPKEEPF